MAKKLRVVTFNVHFGGKIDRIISSFTRNRNLREADIIFLQEAEDRESENISRTRKLGEALGLMYAYAPARKIRAGTHGLAILSRYELLEIETILLPVHKLFWSVQQRIAMTATVRIGGEPLKIANVHLDTQINSAERIAQAAILIEELKKDSGRKIILAGDFNILPFRFWRTIPIAFDDQKKKMHAYLRSEGFSCFCENSGYTLKRGFFRFALDGIYTKNLGPLFCGVERSVRVSDHKPMWLDVEI